MKIAVVNNYFPPASLGGAELYCDDLARGMRARGHDVRVIINMPGVQFHNPAVVNLDLPPNPYTIALLRPQKAVDEALLGALRDFAPDLVHVNNVHATLGFGAYQVAAHWPTVGTMHDYHLFCLKTNNMRVEAEACNNRRYCGTCAAQFYGSETRARVGAPFKPVVDAVSRYGAPLFYALANYRNNGRLEEFTRAVGTVVCPSTAIRRTMEIWGVPQAQLRYIPNGVPAPPALPRAADRQKITFGYVGKVNSDKGVPLLVDAFRGACERGLNAELLVAGDGPDLEALRASAHGTPVSFLGRLNRDQVEMFYESVDVVVVPSIWPDVMPLVVLEAMARGRTVLGADIGGIPEQIGDAGVKFQAGSLQGLTDALLHLGKDSKRVEELGALSRQRYLDEYTLEMHLDRMSGLYEEVLAKRRT